MCGSPPANRQCLYESLTPNILNSALRAGTSYMSDIRGTTRKTTLDSRWKSNAAILDSAFRVRDVRCWKKRPQSNFRSDGLKLTQIVEPTVTHGYDTCIVPHLHITTCSDVSQMLPTPEAYESGIICEKPALRNASSSLCGCHNISVLCYAVSAVNSGYFVLPPTPPPVCCWRASATKNNRCAFTAHSCVTQ